MTITRVALVDGARELVLLDRAALRLDLILTGLDVPSPAVRAVTEDRTDADGEDDHTAYHGARAVSATVALCDTPAALLDQINGYLHPRSRPYLVVSDDEWPDGPRRLRLRADQWSAPIDHTAHLRREHQLQWRAPDGVWEAADETAFIVLAESDVVTGRLYELVTPRTYPETMPTGALTVTNPGTSWADQRVRLYGPCAGPRYTHDDTGETIAFTEELAIPAGEYVEIDTRARSAFYLSDPDASRLSFLDFEVSTWWRLAPGANRVRYHPISDVDPGCQVEGSYRPTWL